MLQYLIILLDDSSTSFCHCDNNRIQRHLIPLDTLKDGIRFGMLENLMIQFVFPEYDLPAEYARTIESIDHSKIKPTHKGADVWITNSVCGIKSDVPVVWRTDKQGLFDHVAELSEALDNVPRINVVLTDPDSFTDGDFDRYKSILDLLSAKAEQMYLDGKSPQLNILTDRMMLDKMNNCGAGDNSITLAPNGKFYVCPAFFYDNESDDVGNLKDGLTINNKQLYGLNCAPICRHCDAYQCKRCIWLNRKTTLEVNTPSHEQCVLAHIERNAGRNLLDSIRRHGSFLPDYGQIQEIKYLDPFEIRNVWQ